MGLYDREYSREPQSGYQFAAPQSATMQLLIATVAVYVVQILFEESTRYLVLPSDWYRRPWEAYRLISYGFAHAPRQIEHILFNMLVLFFFGPQVEQRYGRTKFLTFYFAAVVIGGLTWTATEALAGSGGAMLGASAAITGVFLLFALNFPHAEVRVYFLFPIPAWVAALFCVGGDILGAVNRSGNVAFTAHLGGAAFAWVFYRFGWLPGQGAIKWLGSRPLRTRPKLRVHEPDEDDEPDDLTQQVDAILDKIRAQGQESLTRSERKLLEKASRQYQQKRK